jgi:glycosyltransferase involved in cell wall biosynthesis
LLREAIQSVLNQTFSDFEMLVIDDHSTDNTIDVVASFGDHRVEYVLNDRTRGGAGTRNAGIFRARGEWVAFLDDDDIWLPRKLEVQYQKIQTVEQTAGLIYSGFTIYDTKKKSNVAEFVPTREGFIRDESLLNNVIGTFSTVLIRTSLIKQVGGLDETFPAYQDMELFVRITGLSKVGFVRQNLVQVRRSHEDRISINMEKKLAGSLLFWKKHSNLIDQNCRLRHRAASRVFIYAVVQGNIPEIRKTLFLTLSGLFLDFSNLIRVFRTTVLLIYKTRIRGPLYNIVSNSIGVIGD